MELCQPANINKNIHGASVGSSARSCCCCCFSHSAYWLPTRKKSLYTVANPARGLLNRGKKKKRKKSGSASPFPPTLLVRRKEKEKSRNVSTCLGTTQVSIRLASVQGFVCFGSARPMGAASQNSTLPCAITTFPVSMPLSSPGDV